MPKHRNFAAEHSQIMGTVARACLVCGFSLICLQVTQGLEDVSKHEGESSSSARLLLNRRLGTCDHIHEDEYMDITGYHCDGPRSLYCKCEYDKTRRLSSSSSTKSRWKWECEKTSEETCTVGTPPCQWGKCKDTSQACGNTWASSLQRTCGQVFKDDPVDLAACNTVFGAMKPICPQSAFGTGYRSELKPG